MDKDKITKSATAGTVTAGVPDEEALELVAYYTRNPPVKDDIYTFTVILCDNEIDRDGERFSVDSLNILCKMFLGVTGIFDHSMKSSDQTARIYKTQVVTDENKVTVAGEKYVYLKAWCYMLRTEKNMELIREIDGGIKKEVSISCSCGDRICSVCGKSFMHSECSHTPGVEYGGKMCHAVLTEPKDAYEWSFVAVPAQRNAGVSKSVKSKKNSFRVTSLEPEEIIKSAANANGDIVLSSDQIKAFGCYINGLKADADTGKNARIKAEKEIVALAAFTLPDADTHILRDILKKLDSSEILMLHKAFGDRAQMLGSFEQLFMSQKTKSFSGNEHFKI